MNILFWCVLNTVVSDSLQTFHFQDFFFTINFVHCVTDLKIKPQVSAELAEQSNKEICRSNHSTQKLGVIGRKRHESDGCSEAKTSSNIQDDIYSSGDTDFHRPTSKGKFKLSGLQQKASTANLKSSASAPARSHPAGKRKRADKRQGEACVDGLVPPKGHSESMSMLEFGTMPGDQDESAEATEEASSSAMNQRHGSQEYAGKADRSGEVLQCSVCNKKYPVGKHCAFKQHVKKHRQNVQCETCGKWLSCTDSLKHHQVCLFAPFFSPLFTIICFEFTSPPHTLPPSTAPTPTDLT